MHNLITLLFCVLLAVSNVCLAQNSYYPYTRGVSPSIGNPGGTRGNPTADMVNVTISFGTFGVNGCPDTFNEINSPSICFGYVFNKLLTNNYNVFASPPGNLVCEAVAPDLNEYTMDDLNTLTSYEGNLNTLSKPSGCYANFEMAHWQSVYDYVGQYQDKYLEIYAQGSDPYGNYPDADPVPGSANTFPTTFEYDGAQPEFANFYQYYDDIQGYTPDGVTDFVHLFYNECPNTCDINNPTCIDNDSCNNIQDLFTAGEVELQCPKPGQKISSYSVPICIRGCGDDDNEYLNKNGPLVEYIIEDVSTYQTECKVCPAGSYTFGGFQNIENLLSHTGCSPCNSLSDHDGNEVYCDGTSIAKPAIRYPYHNYVDILAEFDNEYDQLISACNLAVSQIVINHLLSTGIEVSTIDTSAIPVCDSISTTNLNQIPLEQVYDIKQIPYEDRFTEETLGERLDDVGVVLRLRSKSTKEESVPYVFKAIDQIYDNGLDLGKFNFPGARTTLVGVADSVDNAYHGDFFLSTQMQENLKTNGFCEFGTVSGDLKTCCEYCDGECVDDEFCSLRGNEGKNCCPSEINAKELVCGDYNDVGCYMGIWHHSYGCAGSANNLNRVLHNSCYACDNDGECVGAECLDPSSSFTPGLGCVECDPNNLDSMDEEMERVCGFWPFCSTGVLENYERFNVPTFPEEREFDAEFENECTAGQICPIEGQTCNFNGVSYCCKDLIWGGSHSEPEQGACEENHFEIPSLTSTSIDSIYYNECNPGQPCTLENNNQLCVREIGGQIEEYCCHMKHDEVTNIQARMWWHRNYDGNDEYNDSCEPYKKPRCQISTRCTIDGQSCLPEVEGAPEEGLCCINGYWGGENAVVGLCEPFVPIDLRVHTLTCQTRYEVPEHSSWRFSQNIIDLGDDENSNFNCDRNHLNMTLSQLDIPEGKKKGQDVFYYTLRSVLDETYSCFREYTEEEYNYEGLFSSVWDPQQISNLRMKFLADLYVENVAYSTKTYELTIRTVMDFEECIGGVCPSVFNATGFIDVEDVDVEVGPTNVWGTDFDIPLTLHIGMDCEAEEDSLQSLFPGEPVFMSIRIDENLANTRRCEPQSDAAVEFGECYNPDNENLQPPDYYGCCDDQITAKQFGVGGSGAIGANCPKCVAQNEVCLTDDDCCSGTCTMTDESINIRALDIETFSQMGRRTGAIGTAPDISPVDGPNTFFFIQNGLLQYGGIFSKYIVKDGANPCLLFMPMSEIFFVVDGVNVAQFYVSAVLTFDNNEARRRLFLDADWNVKEGIVHNKDVRRKLFQKANQDAIVEVQLLSDASLNSQNIQANSQSQSQQNKNSYGPGSLFFTVGIGFVVVAVVIVVIMLALLMTSRGDKTANVRQKSKKKRQRVNRTSDNNTL